MPARLQDIVEPNDVALDIDIRILDAVAHPGLSGQVHYNVELLFREELVNKAFIGNISLDELVCMLRMILCLLLNNAQAVLLQRRVIVIVQVVQPYNAYRLLAFK